MGGAARDKENLDHPKKPSRTVKPVWGIAFGRGQRPVDGLKTHRAASNVASRCLCVCSRLLGPRESVLLALRGL